MILIIDFGSQVTQLIARRLREAGFYSEIMPSTSDVNKYLVKNPKGIILSGGPNSVTQIDTPRAPYEIWNSVPVLGICYGQQTLCEQLGGKVETGINREFGRAKLDVIADCPLFYNLPKGTDFDVWMSHGDHVSELPDGFKVVACSAGAPFAAIADHKRRYYGVQFHPEVAQTNGGTQILKNFAELICNCEKGWSMVTYKYQAIQKIKEQVGKSGQVICGLSGGVDSSVTAVLLHEAIGERLTCVFVDHGLLRKGEAEEVIKLFGNHLNIKLIHKDASNFFLSKLKGISNPEQKRKIIGASFIDVFTEEAHKIEGAEYLAQGTLYPDVIESISISGGKHVTIKSHHNVGGLPEHMRLKLVEPLRMLFKDEVRLLGKELGLPEVLVNRHPFPGPGLAIRIPGSISSEKINILRDADAIYLEEIRKAGLYDEIWQAFAVLLPVKTVGVMGDQRTYEYVCGLRAVTSTDGMTADIFPFTTEFLAHVSTRIVNEVSGINRVVYDYTSKPPGTIEWE